MSPAEAANAFYVVASLYKNNNQSKPSQGLALPLTGLIFNALQIGRDGVLQWQTATEINTAHFVVEKSSDGTVFKALATLPAAGFSQSIKRYTYTDAQLQGGKHYYRLKTVDRDGKSQYSAVRVLLVGQSGPKALVAPNPFSGTIFVNNLKKGLIFGLIDRNNMRHLQRNLLNIGGLNLQPCQWHVPTQNQFCRWWCTYG